MEKVIVFVDYANINRSAQDAGIDIDYGALLGYLADPNEGRFLQEAFAYVPVDPRQDHAMDQKIQELWDQGFVVKPKVGTIAGQTYKCDFDVEITLDMARAAFNMNPDIVVLVSGDSDFVPVVLELRNKGIRVEVASFGRSMSSLLRHRCSGYINLDLLVDDSGGSDDGWWNDETELEGFGDESAIEYEPILIEEEADIVDLNYEVPESR